MTVIDWSMFDKYPESTCVCTCGATFRSHTKLLSVGDVLVHFSRKPCPSCGSDRDHLARVTGDPEIWGINK